MGDQVLIGYSFWGFLAGGITDTPDGGRSHRATLIDGLAARGHQVVFLQADRDRAEAGTDLPGRYRWDSGLPDVDVLFLEWRWPIPGRNTTGCGTPGHTCDLHRQRALLDAYTAAGVPTLVWDKDRRLHPTDPLRARPNVTVLEPGLRPNPGAVRLLFPVADEALDAADPVALAKQVRDLPLVYVGNQYDRDDAFDRFFAPAAGVHEHVVAGKWPHTRRWPDINFVGRIPFPEVDGLHRRSLATMLLLPHRYAVAAQMTQRLFEAVLAGCLPLTPDGIVGADRFTPPELHVRDGRHAARVIEGLAAIAGSGEHALLLADCLDRLDLMRASRQLDTLDRILARDSIGSGAR